MLQTSEIKNRIVKTSWGKKHFRQLEKALASSALKISFQEFIDIGSTFPTDRTSELTEEDVIKLTSKCSRSFTMISDCFPEVSFKSLYLAIDKIRRDLHSIPSARELSDDLFSEEYVSYPTTTPEPITEVVKQEEIRSARDIIESNVGKSLLWFKTYYDLGRYAVLSELKRDKALLTLWADKRTENILHYGKEIIETYTTPRLTGTHLYKRLVAKYPDINFGAEKDVRQLFAQINFPATTPKSIDSYFKPTNIVNLQTSTKTKNIKNLVSLPPNDAPASDLPSTQKNYLLLWGNEVVLSGVSCQDYLKGYIACLSKNYGKTGKYSLVEVTEEVEEFLA